MAFSNSFSYIETAQTLVTDAVSKLGALDFGDGDTLDPAEDQNSYRNLNRILKSMSATGKLGSSVKMYARQRGYMFLQPNTGAYQLSANQTYWCNAFTQTTSAGNNRPGINTNIHLANTSGINVGTTLGLTDDTGFINWTSVIAVNPTANTVNTTNVIINSMNTTSDICFVITDGSSQPPQVIETCVLRDQSGSDVPVKTDMTYDQWFYLPSKQQPGFTGDPVAIYVEPKLTGANGFTNVFLDVNGAADTTKYLYIGYIRELQDITNPTDFLELPKEWYRAILWELAFDLSDDFGVIWTDQKEMKRQEALKAALGSNPVRSTVGFMPGNRGGIWNMQDGFFSR